MVYGAYAYFKDADNLIALNAVSFGTIGLEFQGPWPLVAPSSSPSSPTVLSDGTKLREFLKASGRIHPVTIGALQQIGVEYFWWLGPGEPVATEDGTAWPFGAFVYMYR